MSEKEGMSVPEFAKRWGISRSLAYQLVKNGDLRAIRLGKRLIIPVAEIERLLVVGNEKGTSA